MKYTIKIKIETDKRLNTTEINNIKANARLLTGTSYLKTNAGRGYSKINSVSVAGVSLTPGHKSAVCSCHYAR